MSSQIERGGVSIRPSFNHYDYKGNTPPEACTSQMLESCRNVLEQIARSQMLECRVANDIRLMRKAVERIDKRLAKRIPLR